MYVKPNKGFELVLCKSFFLHHFHANSFLVYLTKVSFLGRLAIKKIIMKRSFMTELKSTGSEYSMTQGKSFWPNQAYPMTYLKRHIFS